MKCITHLIGKKAPSPIHFHRIRPVLTPIKPLNLSSSLRNCNSIFKSTLFHSKSFNNVSQSSGSCLWKPLDALFCRNSMRWNSTNLHPGALAVDQLIDNQERIVQVSPPDHNLPEGTTIPKLGGIVKVFATVTYPNYILPWQMKASTESTGSGFVTVDKSGNPCILTNAHVVANQTFVTVRKFGSSIRYPAEVRGVGHDCDIAMLSVKEEEFWEGIEPLELGTLPELQDMVSVIGFPQGGDNISLTQGVVSRIDVQQYVHAATPLLTVQIDAAINPGNSGGPVLQNGKVCGIAFQNMPKGENLGFIIPTPIVDHFLEDVSSHKRYMGFGTVGMTCQPLENSYMRKSLGMKPNQSGVLVCSVSPVASNNASVLKKGDVILEIDGIKVANDATIRFRNRGERITFDYYAMNKFVGDKMKLQILREGKEMEVEVEMTDRKFLVPVQSFDIRPSYFVYGGLVFVRLVQPYLHEYGEDWYNASPRKLCYKSIYGDMETPKQEIVVLSHVLTDEMNFGYSAFSNYEVKEFNGVKIENLKQLMDLVDNNKEPFAKFLLDQNHVVVLDREVVEKHGKRILEKHIVPSSRSLDLLQT